MKTSDNKEQPSEQCSIDQFSSRVCERGTKCCEARHTQPSEHAMNTAEYIPLGDNWSFQEVFEVAQFIDAHAIAPAVAEANAAANVRIEARDKQWDDLWANLNGLGIEAVTSGALIYEDGKDPVAERDRRIKELEAALTRIWELSLSQFVRASDAFQKCREIAAVAIAESERSAP